MNSPQGRKREFVCEAMLLGTWMNICDDCKLGLACDCSKRAKWDMDNLGVCPQFDASAQQVHMMRATRFPHPLAMCMSILAHESSSMENLFYNYAARLYETVCSKVECGMVNGTWTN